MGAPHGDQVLKMGPTNGRKLLDILSTQYALKAHALTDGVMKSLSSARESEAQVCEEEIEACQHTLLVNALCWENNRGCGRKYAASFPLVPRSAHRLRDSHACLILISKCDAELSFHVVIPPRAERVP